MTTAVPFLTTIDFGSTPTDTATLVITGLTDMTATAAVQFEIQEDETTVGLGGIENTPSGHETLSFFARCTATARVAGTGVTAKVRLIAGYATGKYRLHGIYVA